MFNFLLHIEKLNHTMLNRKIVNENDFKLFQHFIIENFVANVIFVLIVNYQNNEN